MVLSIIIPIYNCEKYIERCVKSIMNNTNRDIECILVDDGSIDSSFEICKKLQTRDERIKVFHTENKGVSSARNVGLENARGRYVTFVDADDYLDENAINLILGKIYKNNPDCICYGIQRVYDDKRTEHIKYMKSSLNEGFIKYAPYYYSVCNKVFRRGLILNNGIKFDYGITVCEDMLFSFKMLALSSKIIYINDDLYNYYTNSMSVSNIGTNDKRLDDYRVVASLLEDFCRDHNILEQYSEFINYRKLYYYIFFITDLNYFNPTTYREVNKNKLVWKYNNRIDLFLISSLCLIKIDIPAKMYIWLKKRKYLNRYEGNAEK